MAHFRTICRRQDGRVLFWPHRVAFWLLLLLVVCPAPAVAARLFAPDANCSRAEGSTVNDVWWECSRSLRAALYASNAGTSSSHSGGDTAIRLNPNFRYQLGDVPLVGRVLDGGGAVIRPTPGASCVVYLVGGQGGGVRNSFTRATLSGTVLAEFRTVQPVPLLSNVVTVAGHVDVASGSWVFIKVHFPPCN